MARTRDIKLNRMSQTEGKKGKKGKGKGLYKGLNKDLALAEKLAGKYLDLNPLSQVDANIPTETQNLLNSLQALADPTYGSYAGARTPEMQATVDRMQAGLEGYNSQELNALREQRRRETERGFQSGRASLARGQNNYRVGNTQRAAQLMELSKAYGQSSADAENDLFVRGADEKQRRLESYGEFTRGLGKDEFDRGGYAREQYAKAMRDAQLDQFERQKLNLGQEAGSKAIKEAGKLSMFGLAEARRNARQQNKLMRDLEKMRSGGRAPSSTTNYYVEAVQEEADRLTNGAPPSI